MKLILSLLFSFCALGTQSAWAGPGDGPVVPWPTKSLRYEINLEAVAGEWFGFAHNSIWFVKISPLEDMPEVSAITLDSRAIFKGSAAGLLTADDRLLVGVVYMDENHTETLLIFKDIDGTKLRMQSGQHDYVDIKLYPLPTKDIGH